MYGLNVRFTVKFDRNKEALPLHFLYVVMPLTFKKKKKILIIFSHCCCFFLIPIKITECTPSNTVTFIWNVSFPACNCNGFSNRCYFDKDLYELTGHGGHCLDCEGNRDGANCERCKENYFEQNGEYCVACNCNEIGTGYFDR